MVLTSNPSFSNGIFGKTGNPKMRKTPGFLYYFVGEPLLVGNPSARIHQVKSLDFSLSNLFNQHFFGLFFALGLWFNY